MRSVKLSRDRLDKLELAFGLCVGAIITAVLACRIGAIFIGMLIGAGLLAILLDRFIYYSRARLDDERLEKIYMFSSMTALFTTMIMIVGLRLIMAIRLVPEISGSALLAIMLYLMFAVFMIFVATGWSWILFRAYYYFKGDVE